MGSIPVHFNQYQQMCLKVQDEAGSGLEEPVVFAAEIELVLFFTIIALKS
jgi:hypothetical protein